MNRPAAGAVGGIDLSDCDREPIHVPGSVQAHGALLIVDRAGIVQGAAGATAAFVGVAPTGALGRTLADLLPAEVVAEALKRRADAARPAYVGRFAAAAPGAEADLLAHERDGWLVVEMEPARLPRETGGEVLTILDRASERIETAHTPRGLAQAAAQAIRRITGYGRVMVYRFLEDGSGVVLAEDRDPRHSSFLNHYFPATDIPQQARALYLRNLVRVIPDVAYEPAPVVWSADHADAVLDMSDCVLRSVSPVHIQYLRNMDVAASMSVSVLYEGRLWGLVACHHDEPRAVPYESRQLCLQVGRLLSQQLKARQEADEHAEMVRLQGARDTLAATVVRAGRVLDWLLHHPRDVAAAIPAEGAAIVAGGEVRSFGLTPEPDLCRTIADRLIDSDGYEPFATDRLSQVWPETEAARKVASGILGIVLSQEERIVLIWFRPERLQTIAWAGNPHKEARGPSGALTPRHSFEAWEETVRGRSVPWSTLEIRSVRMLRDTLADLRYRERIVSLNQALQKTLADKDELLAQKDLLMGEANHRVQNSLQLVGSMLELQARQIDVPEVHAAFDEARRRLLAVSMIHRRLWHSDRIESVDLSRYLEELRKELMQSWDKAWGPHIVFDASPVSAPAAVAVSLALVLIELLTNAVKYAYDGAPGPVEVVVRSDGSLAVRLIVADEGKGSATGDGGGNGGGFGSRLVRGLVAQSGGTMEVADNGPGTRVTVVMPLRREGAA